MAGKVKAVPEGSHTITAHLAVRDASKAIEFYQKAFGAEVRALHKAPDGKVMHASLRIGDSSFMLADENPARGFPSPQTLGGSPVILQILVEDVDALFDRAVAAGGKVIMPLANQFWGDRYGMILDPLDQPWALGSHVEDVAPEELERRAREAFEQRAKTAGT